MPKEAAFPVPFREYTAEEIDKLSREKGWDAEFTKLVIERAGSHYYVTDKTGNRYRDGRYLDSNHWNHRGPLHVTMTQAHKARTPLVELQSGLGFGAHYTPAELRALAATLIRIADDADAHPMGPRSFYRSDRGYDVTAD